MPCSDIITLDHTAGDTVYAVLGPADRSTGELVDTSTPGSWTLEVPFGTSMTAYAIYASEGIADCLTPGSLVPYLADIDSSLPDGSYVVTWFKREGVNPDCSADTLIGKGILHHPACSATGSLPVPPGAGEYRLRSIDGSMSWATMETTLSAELVSLAADGAGPYTIDITGGVASLETVGTTFVCAALEACELENLGNVPVPPLTSGYTIQTDGAGGLVWMPAGGTYVINKKACCD